MVGFWHAVWEFFLSLGAMLAVLWLVVFLVLKPNKRGGKFTGF